MAIFAIITRTLMSKSFFSTPPTTHNLPSLRVSAELHPRPPTRPIETVSTSPYSLPSTAAPSGVPSEVGELFVRPVWGKSCLSSSGGHYLCRCSPDWDWRWPVTGVLSHCVSCSSCGPPQANWAVGGTPALGPRARWKPLSAPTLPGKPPHGSRPARPCWAAG